MENRNGVQIAVIGAGPAGLFASEALVAKGFGVALFNRDIKPGGLAEYGIFPDKYKLKNGLRNQFASILGSERISYYGNIHIGIKEAVTLNMLFGWGFSAVLVACGAQGIKSLKLPGEDLAGVYHAKDLVYHYNALPPYSEKIFDFGNKTAIVGAGNVMADISHYLTKYSSVEEITVLIRRGPGEVKFDKKEALSFISYLDLNAYEREMERVSAQMANLGQDVVAIKGKLLTDYSNAVPKEREVNIRFRFLASPKRMVSKEDNRVTTLEYEDNALYLEDGEVKARGTGKLNSINLDSVIFAIGDSVLDEMGLPMDKFGFCHAKNPRYPIEGDSYEVEDPQTGEPITGIFLAGWSRNPSTGLVGTARKDGVRAASAISQFLDNQSLRNGIDPSTVLERLKGENCLAVTKDHLLLLESAEKKQAAQRGLEEYKFATNDEMLKIMGLG